METRSHPAPDRPPVVVHRLDAGEVRDYEAFLLALDPQSRRERFNGAVGDEAVRRHARRAISRGSILFGAYEQGRVCGVAELCPDGAGVAEIALAVAPRARRRGVGTLLMDGVALAAANRGYRLLKVVCLATNRAMSRLAAKRRATFSISANQITGTIALPRPSSLTLGREMAAETLARFSRFLQRSGAPPT